MPFSLLQSLGEIPLAVVDVETTGASRIGGIGSSRSGSRGSRGDGRSGNISSLSIRAGGSGRGLRL